MTNAGGEGVGPFLLHHRAGRSRPHLCGHPLGAGLGRRGITVGRMANIPGRSGSRKSRRLQTLRSRALRGVSRLILKAKIATSQQRLDLPPDALGLLFQYNAGNARFYTATNGRVPIRLSESPHAAFAKDASTSEVLPDGAAQSAYRAFLKASWSALPHAPSLGIDDQVQRFWELAKSRQANDAPVAPITVTRMPGGECSVYRRWQSSRGNCARAGHRADSAPRAVRFGFLSLS